MSDPILDLLAAPPSPSLSVDEHAVYAGGRRRLRQRTMRRTAVGVVGIASVAAIAFGALGAGVDNDTLPAGPTPSASSSGRASANLLDGRYAVEVLPGVGKDQPNLILSSVQDGKRTQLARTRANPQVISVGSTEAADGVMLGVAPVGGTQFNVVAGGSQGGISVDRQPLPGTEFQAIAIKFENAREASKYTDVLWLDDKGIVRDSGAGSVPSALIPGTRDRAYADRNVKKMGVFSDDGGYAGPLFSVPETVGVAQRGTRDEATNTWTWTATIALLENAREPDLDLTWSPGTVVGKQVTFASDGNLGPMFVNVTATRVGADAPKLTSVKFRGYLDDKPRTFVVP